MILILILILIHLIAKSSLCLKKTQEGERASNFMDLLELSLAFIFGTIFLLPNNLC